MSDVKAVAFYLPQYHPIPENDAWWGRGYTEWTKVAQGRAMYAGHAQPHLPADLGFYDLRLAEAREAQAALAREYGVYGFCYYHYWFNGRRVLERPFEEVLASGRPDFPFCICWANENWTRRWDGKENEVLLQQSYSAEDDIAHLRSLLPAFRDPRYIRIDDKPLLLVYRFSHLPEPQATIGRWRDEARKAGFPGLFLCNVESFAPEHGLAARFGLDAAVEFAPDWSRLPMTMWRGRRNALRYMLAHRRMRPRVFVDNYVVSYERLAENMMAKPQPDYLRFPGVTPMWDNIVRRQKNAIILDGSSPPLYERWLRDAAARARRNAPGRQFVFINAWNEWGEGNHLEPCQRWGRGYLEATRDALSSER